MGVSGPKSGSENSGVRELGSSAIRVVSPIGVVEARSPLGVGVQDGQRRAAPLESRGRRLDRRRTLGAPEAIDA